jgi:integral membrane protein
MARPSLVRAVRYVGLLEGLSYFVLLFVAMPLKYAMDLPMAVRIVGAVHGALFVLLGCLIASALFEGALTRKESAMVAIASLVPFGPLFIDARLRKALARASSQTDVGIAP